MNCLHIYNYIDTHSLESNTFLVLSCYSGKRHSDKRTVWVCFGFFNRRLCDDIHVVHTCMSIFNLIVKLKTLLLHTFVRTTLVWILKQTRNLFVFLDSSLINMQLFPWTCIRSWLFVVPACLDHVTAHVTARAAV